MRLLFSSIAVLGLLLNTAVAREGKLTAQLPENARVAIIGDSITEQKLYSKYLETYLLACAGRDDISCFQYGWGGERADGFALRCENDLAIFKPTVATLCYGMNDGGYTAHTESIGATYEKNMRTVLAKLQGMGVKNIIVGSPGAVDTKYFTRIPAAVYNDSLARFRSIDQKLAAESAFAFANVHDLMFETMVKAKATMGDGYDVCGKDGVHPGANGQLLMAYAFLRGMGVDGEIAKIQVDLKGDATVSEGHKLVSSNKSGPNGTTILEVESKKWPFCFDGDQNSPGGTRSITRFCNFNREMNRYTLTVKNLGAPKANVTWGSATKTFTADQLAAGVNLAAEFEQTPFDKSFMDLMRLIADKQSHETVMIKNMITQFRAFEADIKEDAEFAAALEVLKKKLEAKHAARAEAVKQKLVPVKYQLKIEPQQ